MAVSAATRALDEGGKGLAPNTILRNAEAREFFHQQSESYQERQQRAGKAKRRRSRPRVCAKLSADYRGLRASDLVQIIEQLKQTLHELETRQTKLEADRDVMRQCCTELQQQNVRQLAALTSQKKTTPN